MSASLPAANLSAQDEYYSHARESLLDMARGRPRSVLDIGCAGGTSLRWFGRRGSDRLTGIELREDVALRAAEDASLEIHVGTLDSALLAGMAGGFDLIVASFVLEHVADPWTTLERIQSLLAPLGQFIGSVPNVRHISVTVPLMLKGRWDHTDEGVLDRTHLRYFTKRNTAEMLGQAGFSVDAIVPEFGGRKSKLLQRASFGLAEDFAAYAYNFSATKPA